MCDFNLLYDTKEILKFLLNNNNRAYNTINTLQDDFFKFTGCTIPFYDLGYRFLETFFSSIPDILWIHPVTKNVISSNKRNPTYWNVMNTCFFKPKVLPWYPSVTNWCYNNSTQWMQRGYHYAMNKNNFRTLGKSSNNSKEFKSLKTISSEQTLSSKIRNYALSQSQEGNDQLLRPRKYGNGESLNTTSNKPQNIIADVVTNGTSVNTSLKLVTFSSNANDNETLTSMTIDPQELDLTNKLYLHNDDHIDNVPLVDTNENAFLTTIPALVEPEKCSNWNHPNNDIKASVGNSSNTESEPPAYSEKDMTNVTCDNDNDNLNIDLSCSDSGRYLNTDSSDDEPLKKTVHFNVSSSSEDEDKCKLSSPTSDSNEAIPFMSDNDPIQLIGSKFAHERYGNKIETENIENKMEVGKFYELYISEVNNPNKFWFQLVEDNYCELDELQQQLNTFYNVSIVGSPDMIEERYMVKGYACAALFDTVWHRAEFIKEPDSNKVKVFFVDYGTVFEVSTQDVRYLLNNFCKLPKLCFRGTLDFIKAKTIRWNREATAYFCDLIRNVKLAAGVSEIDTTNNVARIYVMDINKSICVNYTLVENGHAFPEDPRDRHHNYIADALPTFESLENGKHPSLQQVDKYMAEGFDVDKIFETSVIEEFDCYIPQYTSDEEAIEIMEKYHRKKEKAKEIAMERDPTTFLTFFGRMLNNPFLNSMKIPMEEVKNDSSTNPFLRNFDNSDNLLDE